MQLSTLVRLNATSLILARKEINNPPVATHFGEGSVGSKTSLNQPVKKKLRPYIQRLCWLKLTMYRNLNMTYVLPVESDSEF